MKTSEAANLYESAAVRSVSGNTIRPGGLALTRRAMALCGFKTGARVLDAGCGTGATVAYLKNHRGLNAFGLDLSRKLLREGRSRSTRLALVRARAEQVPFSGGIFSGVLCECLLSLLAYPAEALKEFHRVLTAGGLLILSDLYTRSGEADRRGEKLPVRCCLNGALDRSAVEELLIQCGFRVLVWEDHTAWLKHFAAELVLAYGSIASFWHAAGMQRQDCTFNGYDNRARPGYYLLVARKEGLDGGFSHPDDEAFAGRLQLQSDSDPDRP